MKNRTIALALSLLLVIAAASFLTACGTDDGRSDTAVSGESVIANDSTQLSKPASIKELDVQDGQNASGAPIKNYTALLYADTNWKGMSDVERQAVIDYTFAEVYKRAKENGVRNYKITGAREGSLDLLFWYDLAKDEIVVCENETELSRVSVPRP